MLTAYSVHYGESRPDDRTGLVLVSPDGTRWTVGGLTGKFSGQYHTSYHYDVTTEAIWTHDEEGRRRLVRADRYASYDDEERAWCVETFDGGWHVYVAPLYNHSVRNTGARAS